MTQLSNKQKLAFSVLSIVFSGLLIFAYLSYLHIREIVKQEDELYIESILDKWVHWREHNFATIQALADTLAASEDSPARREKIRFFLSQAAKSGELMYLGYGLENGFYDVNDWAIPADYDPRTRPWYQASKASLTPRITWPYKSPLVDSPLYISLTTPIVRDDTFIGVATGDITMAFLEKDLLRDLLAKGGDAFLIAPNGQILIHHDKALIGQHISQLAPRFAPNAEFKLNDYQDIRLIEGADVDYRITTLSHSDSLFVLVTSHAHMEQQLKNETFRLLAYFPAVLVLIAFCLYVYNKRLFSPIIQSLEFDADTQLPNKNNIKRQIAHRLQQQGTQGLLLLFSTDNFNQLVAAYSKATVTQLQNEAKSRIQSKLRADSQFGFFSENRFIAFSPIQSQETAIEWLEYIQALSDELNQPYFILEQELHCTISIGASSFPTDANELELLIDNAFTALGNIQAQKSPHYCLFTPEHNQQLSESLILSNAIKKALANEEFYLVYQPQIDAPSTTIKGAEALIRWQSQELGRQISPGEFIPVAEASDLIVELGDFVIRTAVKQAGAWNEMGVDYGKISVNISPRQLLKPDFIGKLLHTLASYRVTPSQIELEITETTVIHEPTRTIHILHQLKDLGFSLAMDDFGTGYSSLEYLRKLPLNKVKIDRAFIQDIDSDEKGCVITKMIIGMAKALEFTPLAEGVETSEQLAYLDAHGCYLIQGYWFSKPLLPGEFEQFARREKTHNAQSAQASQVISI